MIYIGCNTQVQMLGLTNNATGATVDNAVVAATLFDDDGNTLYSTTLPSAGSGGNYSGNIPATTTQQLQAGGNYTVNVVATLGGVQIDERNEIVQVTFRGLNEQLL